MHIIKINIKKLIIYSHYFTSIFFNLIYFFIHLYSKYQYFTTIYRHKFILHELFIRKQIGK